MGKCKMPIIGGSGGTNIVNGAIKEYKAQSGEISANTFVEYVAEGITIGTEKSNISTGGTSYGIDCIGVSSNRVLMVYTDSASNGDSSYTSYKYALLSLDNKAVQVLATGAFMDNILGVGLQRVQLAEIKQGKYLVSCLASSGDTYLLVCSISGNTVNFGATLALGDCYQPWCVPISESKFLFSHVNKAGYYRAAVYSINGTTLTTGTSVNLCSAYSTTLDARTGKIGEGLYLGLISYGSDRYLRTCLIRVSGSSVSCVEEKIMSYSEYTGDDIGDIHYIGGNRALVIKSNGYGNTGVFIYEAANSAVSQVASLNLAAQTNYEGGKICEMADGTFMTTITTGNIAVHFSVNGNTVTQLNSVTVDKNTTATYHSKIAQGNDGQFAVCYNAATDYVTNKKYATAKAFQQNEEGVKVAQDSIFGLTRNKLTKNTPGKVWVLA